MNAVLLSIIWFDAHEKYFKELFFSKGCLGVFCLSFFLLLVKVYSFSRLAFVSVINFPYFFHIPFCGSVHINFQEVCSSSWKLLHFCIHCVKTIIQCNLDDSIPFFKIIYWDNLGHLGNYLNFFILCSLVWFHNYFFMYVSEICAHQIRYGHPDILFLIGLCSTKICYIWDWPFQDDLLHLLTLTLIPVVWQLIIQNLKKRTRSWDRNPLFQDGYGEQIVYLLPYQLQSQFLLLRSLQMLSYRPWKSLCSTVNSTINSS